MMRIFVSVFAILFALGCGSKHAADPAEDTAMRPRAIALYDGPGVGGPGPDPIARALNDSPIDCVVTRVSPEDIRGGALKNYSVVIIPGGGGTSIAKALGEEGRAAMTQYVRDGGGYVGICAGAYLALVGDPFLSFVGLDNYSPWQTGEGDLELQLTPEGEKILGKEFSHFTTFYQNGPLFPDGAPGIEQPGEWPTRTTLARYATPVTNGGKKQEHMVGTPAIIATTFGKGRVMLLGPHLETRPELNMPLSRAVLWAAQLKAPVSAK